MSVREIAACTINYEISANKHKSFKCTFANNKVAYNKNTVPKFNVCKRYYTKHPFDKCPVWRKNAISVE